MNKQMDVKRLTVLALLTAVLLLMSWTPLGYLNIGPLAITLNMIPVAIAAITLGPSGGAFVGAVFGLTSFLQCIGVGGVSAMGQVLFGINPFLAFLQRFLPRVLTGFVLGYVFRGVAKITSPRVSCFITGFFAAFLNTALFMLSLVVLFGGTEYVQTLMGGHNVLVWICLFVGINAVFEMITSTMVTGGVGIALHNARLTDPKAERK